MPDWFDANLHILCYDYFPLLDEAECMADLNDWWQNVERWIGDPKATLSLNTGWIARAEEYSWDNLELDALQTTNTPQKQTITGRTPSAITNTKIWPDLRTAILKIMSARTQLGLPRSTRPTTTRPPPQLSSAYRPQPTHVT